MKPLILTDRLIIRRFEPQDSGEFFAYRSMPEVTRYQSWKPTNIGEIESFILDNLFIVPETLNAWMQLAVCLHGGKLIGDIGVHSLKDQQTEIGYTISPSYQGRGYATEAVKAVIGYLFAELGKYRITASVDPNNTASIRLLEKLGFRKEAHFIKSFKTDDGWTDECVYAILREEWR